MAAGRNISEKALQRISECLEKQLPYLNLSNCGLREIPMEIFEFDWLKSLNLGNIESNDESTNSENIPNYYAEFYAKPLPNLRILIMANCGLFDVEFISNFLFLKELYLSNNDISDIKPLRYVINNKKLKILDLSKNPISDISPIYNEGMLGTLIENKELLELNLEKTKIPTFRFLEFFSELISLNIDANLPTIGAYDLKGFTKLTNLRLSAQELIGFENFEGLKSLESLILTFEKGDISFVKNLTNLTNLTIKSSKIDDLTGFDALINLKELNLSNNLISDITPLRKLENLEILNLENNQIVDIKPLIALKKLNSINISNNKIQFIEPLIQLERQNVLSPELLKLNTELGIESSGLQAINVDISISINENPIEDFPANRLPTLQFLRDVKNFFVEDTNCRTIPCREIKLILVGNSASGKTNLANILRGGRFNNNENTTHGVIVKRHKIGDLFVSFWDFGGQELQYMTHQFFLTPRGLYVLMMNARKESPNLAYWFKIISLLGRDNQDSTERVKLLLVFNKRGNTTGTPQYQDQLKHYADTLDVQYLEVDFAENDYRFEALQKAIQQSLVTLPIVKSQLPRLWKVVREDLREEAKNNQYITTDRYSDMCSKHGITEEADQWLLSGYLHQLGSLLHFQNDKGLMHFVILSPQWATDGVYTFLSAESIKENNGRFTDIAFNQLLAAKGYKRADANLVLQLMTKNNFDICYEATEGNYVAAQLLPENRPDAFLWNRQTGAPLQFRYQYPIMPKGLMSRLIVRLSEYIEVVDYQEVVWKKGVILRIPTDKNNADNCSRVLMYEDDAESKSGLRQIIIEVMGNPQGHRKHALQRVREEVESLHKKWFRSIKADEMVPCCCSECEKSDNPQLFKLTNLLARRLKRNDTSCDMSGEDLLIQTLLDGVYDKGEIREMENMGRY